MSAPEARHPSHSINRRRVVQGLAAAAVAGSAPLVLGAARKADPASPIIGAGEHQYECHHGWGTPPASVHWFNTHGVAVDSSGLVYVKHQGAGGEPMDTIVVFDPDGKAVRSFGKEYHGGGHGIDIRKEGSDEFLYLCDIENRQVVKSTVTGERIWKLSFPAEAGVYEKVEQFRPTNVAFGPDGGFYVGDGYGSHYIHQYGPDAKWIRTWGGEGDAPGKMRTPHGLMVDQRPGREPSLVVADRANARLQYFSLDGKHLGFVSDVLFPAHFDIRGDVLLVPDLHARVSLFGVDNKPIVHLGDDAAWIAEVKNMKIRDNPSQWQPGKFVHPHDACFDAEGNIFVVEWVTAGRVTKLKKV